MAFAILGNLLKKGLELRESTLPKDADPYLQQKEMLKHLLSKSVNTEFGRKYGFSDLLRKHNSDGSAKGLFEDFKSQVPIHDYNKIFEEWWCRSLEGEADICWPGTVKYFALSSGTSEASTKHIPITKDMTKAIQNTSKKQILTLPRYDIPAKVFQTGVLMLGGSTSLNYNGVFYEGDLSGIQAKTLPTWFSPFYKPGKKIARTPEWGEKLDQIVENANSWDIGAIVGVPAWLQLLMEKIIENYGLNHIHEIWPNLTIFTHGGVAFDPYKKSFEKLLGKPLVYMETYLASEGFIAYQDRPNQGAMTLSYGEGLYFEFVPFNDSNFDQEGQMKPDAETLCLEEVEEGLEYALLLSTVAGAWRYQIGDTIRIINKKNAEIVITGRTKHFLSLVGEHLSVDNMNKAVEKVCKRLNVEIKEFTVCGEPFQSLFAHRWFVGMESNGVDEEEIAKAIDMELMILNDDYRTERAHALKDMRVKVIDNEVFHLWLKKHGKEGGQIKFPRVMKGEKLSDWKEFLSEKGII